MAIHYQKNRAIFDGNVSVEEAEDLLQWRQSHPDGEVDLADCTHLHAAVLQVLMAAPVAVPAWPQNEDLTVWLRAALTTA